VKQGLVSGVEGIRGIDGTGIRCIDGTGIRGIDGIHGIDIRGIDGLAEVVTEVRN